MLDHGDAEGVFSVDKCERKLSIIRDWESAPQLSAGRV